MGNQAKFLFFLRGEGWNGGEFNHPSIHRERGERYAALRNLLRRKSKNYIPNVFKAVPCRKGKA